MKKYKFLKHTADAKFVAYGKSLEEAFSNAALAMFSIMVDTKKVEKKEVKLIKVEAEDLVGLLYRWLEELLFLLDSDFFVLSSIKKLKIKHDKDYSLKAEVTGDKFEEKYERLGGVKAVTYNDMQVKKEGKGKFLVQVVLDL